MDIVLGGLIVVGALFLAFQGLVKISSFMEKHELGQGGVNHEPTKVAVTRGKVRKPGRIMASKVKLETRVEER